MVNAITSLEQFDELKSTQEFFLLGFYTDASESSRQAIQRLDSAQNEFKDTPVYTVNASKFRDIHPKLGVSSVPTVLALRQGAVTKNIQGLQTQQHYEMLFYDAPVKSGNGKVKRQPSVTVYSTPTCSWCNRLKQHLRKNRIRFADVDVSRDPSAAQELMSRTGQSGVPQTNIDGQWIVGFDQTRIDTLLSIGR
mgnify:CR=1 FL=1